MRFWEADVLEKLGDKYNVRNWSEASILFRQSGEKIMKLCEAALKHDKGNVSNLLTEKADIEEHAYRVLKEG